MGKKTDKYERKGDEENRGGDYKASCFRGCNAVKFGRGRTDVLDTASIITVDPEYTASYLRREKFSSNAVMVSLGQMLRHCLPCLGSGFTEGQASLKIPPACPSVARNSHDSDVIGVEGTGARKHVFKGACETDALVTKAVWRRMN